MLNSKKYIIAPKQLLLTQPQQFEPPEDESLSNWKATLCLIVTHVMSYSKGVCELHIECHLKVNAAYMQISLRSQVSCKPFICLFNSLLLKLVGQARLLHTFIHFIYFGKSWENIILLKQNSLTDAQAECASIFMRITVLLHLLLPAEGFSPAPLQPNENIHHSLFSCSDELGRKWPTDRTLFLRKLQKFILGDCNYCPVIENIWTVLYMCNNSE